MDEVAENDGFEEIDEDNETDAKWIRSPRQPFYIKVIYNPQYYLVYESQEFRDSNWGFESHPLQYLRRQSIVVDQS